MKSAQYCLISENNKMAASAEKGRTVPVQVTNAYKGNGHVPPPTLNVGTSRTWSAPCSGRFIPNEKLLVPIQ